MILHGAFQSAVGISCLAGYNPAFHLVDGLL
jgi:hypothetical protein